MEIYRIAPKDGLTVPRAVVILDTLDERKALWLALREYPRLYERGADGSSLARRYIPEGDLILINYASQRLFDQYNHRCPRESWERESDST